MENDVTLLGGAEFQEAVAVLARAFSDYPFVHAMYEGVAPDARLKRLVVPLSASLKACALNGLPLHVRENGKVSAVALVHPPGAYPLSTATQLSIMFKMVTRNSPFVVRRWLQYISLVEDNHPKDPHYYLELLGVDPPMKGKGLGSSILSYLGTKADQDRVGCFLETDDPRNLPLYQRFGFETVSEGDVIGVHCWFMWRPPARQG